MKRLIVAALLIVGITSFAQESKEKPQRTQMEQLNPEQRNQLRLKRLTLDLDLDASQQKEMSKIIAEQSAKREAAMAERKAIKDAGKKLTPDERFAKQNKMLDEKIAMKARMKKILNAEQFEKWDKMKKHGQGSMRKKMVHKKKKMDRLEDK
ncbi:MAG: hypothetical protein ABWZ56_09070 [Flavobacterium sp.]